MLHYPVTLVNKTAAIAGNSSTFRVDHIQPGGIITKGIIFDRPPSSFTTLGEVALVARNKFDSKATGMRISIQATGSVASQYIDYSVAPTDYFTTQELCSTNWKDPTSDIVDALKQNMFGRH